MKTILATLLSSMLLWQSLWGESRAEKDFWQAKPETSANSKAQMPGFAFLDAGIIYYARGGDIKDEHSGGVKVTGSLRETFDHLYFRFDVWAVVDNAVEGTIEGQLALVKGLNLGLGAMATDHLDFTPRLGLYIEDQVDLTRRLGFYLLDSDSGGIEFNWPVAEQWSLNGDASIEEEDNIKARRFILGMLYRF